LRAPELETGARKRVLALHFSQTGQTADAIGALVAPLERQGFEVVRERLETETAFPFPWGVSAFFDVMPETVTGHAPPLKPLSVDPDERFDLVVLGYQVWYLSPSLPAQALFQSEYRRLLAGTPVVTVVVSRNMWYSAADKMRRLLADAGSIHVGNVAVTDPGPAWTTFITTPRLLFTGRRDRFLRIFPPAGISEESVRSLSRLGEEIGGRVGKPERGPSMPLFNGREVSMVNRRLVGADRLASLLFAPWARAIARVSRPGQLRRAVLLGFFGAWLTAAIVLLMPLVVVGQLLLAPLVRRRMDDFLRPLLEPRHAAQATRVRVAA
jgi:hypothetical protein